MDPNAELMFEYLRAAIYDPEHAQLDLDALAPDFLMLGKGLIFYVQSILEINSLASSLARGDLSVELPSRENEMASPLKTLHASLRHLTWQTQQVAKGDYKQRVDFMGEFSKSFNTMIRQLDNRQQALLKEIESGRQKTRALEQSNALMVVVADSIPQNLIVFEEGTGEILFCNNAVKAELAADLHFVDKLRLVISENLEKLEQGEKVEFVHSRGGVSGYLSMNSYPIQWGKTKARAYMASDISAERKQLEKLEHYAYRDELTKLHNRYYGMNALNDWLEEKKQFILTFIDLNNLKFINDNYGHIEGDRYIATVARYLMGFSLDAVVCRVGGDEFMILAPDLSEAEAEERMREVALGVERDPCVIDKEYRYSISYGVVEVDPGDERPASKILQLADDRMYLHKRRQKAAGRALPSAWNK